MNQSSASLVQPDDLVGGFNPTPFRNYSPTFGRWMSPDPLAGDILNPQSLNRYAYVLNNPTNLIDPLGLDTGDPCTPNPDGSVTCPPTTITVTGTGGTIARDDSVPQGIEDALLRRPGSIFDLGGQALELIFQGGRKGGRTGTGTTPGTPTTPTSTTQPGPAPNLTPQLPSCIGVFFGAAFRPFSTAVTYVKSVPGDIKAGAAAAQNAGVTLTQLTSAIEAMAQAGAADPQDAAITVGKVAAAAAFLQRTSGVLTTAGQVAAKYTPVTSVAVVDISLAYALVVETNAAMNGKCQ